jgi:oligo-1,6-glucosidase
MVGEKGYRPLSYVFKHLRVILIGDCRDLTERDTHLYVYTRQLDGRVWLIILNHADDETPFSLAGGFNEQNKELMIANYPDVLPDDSIAHVTLRPHEARISSFLA